ncbi:MAG: PAS domain-containing sensor histidine kinase [Gammaproteobacteria bacterium]|nr:PAS domain-containing sensor histidine kinase [Gammaproteobacteria bacterium]
MQQGLASPTQSRVAELERAFSEFTETSLQLETAYRELEQRAAHLSRELARTQDERLVYLQEKEQLADRLQGLLETLPAAVIVLDAAGNIEDCNPGAGLLLGKNLAGQPWTTIVAERFAREGDGAGEFLLRDGRTVSLSTRKAGDGRIVLLTDVTETRRLQKMLSRNQRLTEMGQMNARLAHQLRTPLATAVLYASQLKKYDQDERTERYATKILNSLQLLERMVNDMLRFAGGSCGEHHETIAINELFAEVAAQLEARLEQGIELEFGAPAGLMLTGDREALVGALLNLANNAIDHGRSDDSRRLLRIELAAETAEDHLRLSVTDNGPGVASDVIKRIFDPFYTTRPQGTGLGLAVVDAVARGHGGRVDVTRPSSGGACFALLLPARNRDALQSGRNNLALRNEIGEVA